MEKGSRKQRKLLRTFFVCDRRKEDRKIRSADCLRYHGKINRMKNCGKGRIKTERESFVILPFPDCKQGKRRSKMKIAVCWERVNEISVKELLEMAEDGYEFILQDGRISGIFVPRLEN